MRAQGKRTSKSVRRWRQAAHCLDHPPLPRVIAAGAVLGLSLGLPGFFYLRSPAWMLLWSALFRRCGASAATPSRCTSTTCRSPLRPSGWVVSRPPHEFLTI